MKQHRDNTILFLVSFIILFLELGLIRWISTEIRIFAYLSNFVLLACFLGGGLGCYLSDKKNRLYITFFMIALLVLFVKLPLYIKTEGFSFHLFRDIPIFLGAFKDTVIPYQKTAYNLRFMQSIGVLATVTMFFCMLLCFFPLGQVLGRVFDRHSSIIKAYSINIIASLLGIWAINGLAFMYTTPFIWLLLTLVLLFTLVIFLKDYSVKNILLMVLSFAIVVGFLSVPPDRNTHGMTIWTPYQKLTLKPIRPYPAKIDPFETRSVAGYMIDVNNVGFMNMHNLSDDFRKYYPIYFEGNLGTVYDGEKETVLNAFNFPFLLKKDAKSVLILGAGGGSDVAGALRSGLEKVDAVEIDPGIYDLGVKYHPENPYADSRVRMFIDDARSFIKKSHDKYDLIYYGLLDAHAQSSNLNNMRMDHYVYTEESFREAKEKLSDNGVMIVSYWVNRIWLGKRVEDLIEKVFGWEPIVLSFKAEKDGLGRIMVIAAEDKSYVFSLFKNDPVFFNFLINRSLNYTTEDVTPRDDWPYMYLRKPLIPGMYLCFIGILLAIFFLSKRLLLGKGQHLEYHFFFLGAGFLLVEFQNINKTALLFGSTWIVNSINITAILTMSLLANLFVSRVKIKSLKIPYALLFLSLLIVFLVPLNVFNFLGYWQKSFLASILLNIPIFFAGIIFITSFRRSQQKNLAFGSNLIGAAAGGLLECLSFLIGVRMLVLVTMGLYLLSLAFLKRKT